MLSVKESQLEVFEAPLRSAFVERSVHLLRTSYPAWAAEKSDGDIRQFVEQEMEFGKSIGVRREKNLQAIMGMRIETALNVESHPYPYERLTESDVDESHRVENCGFALEARLHRVSKITDGTDRRRS